MIDRYRQADFPITTTPITPPHRASWGLLAIGMMVLTASGGCHRLQPASIYPPPPSPAETTSSYPRASTGPSAAAAHPAAAGAEPAGTPGSTDAAMSEAGASDYVVDDGSATALRRPPLTPRARTAAANMPAAPSSTASPETIVRGQGGGFAIPPTFQQAADGGRHSREPLPVSGQPTATVAAAAPATNPATTQTPAPAQTPAVAQTQYTSPPGYVPPATTGQPIYPQPAPTTSAPQPGYGVLPEIAGEDLVPGIALGQPLPYTPLTRTADIIVNGYPARTGRIMFGGAVNSDAGVTGQITIEERNFDITRFPRSFQDLVGGTAFRGAGQTFRVEAVPGSDFKRYSVNFTEPYIFGYMPISMSVSGFLFDRRYQDWDEERLGGRLSFGYRITPDLSISAGVRGENVDVSNPRVTGVPQLDSVLGDNEIYSGQLQLTHDTRNSPFAPSEGHYMTMSYEQAFGDFDYPRGEIALSKYFLVRERADGSGKQTLTTGWSLGFSGEDTPIFENYFAGGYSTMRGFEFRGASPTVNGVQVGGRFQFLGTVEYMFPLTADDMLRGVAFVDYGTIEQDIEINSENFRVAPGVGLRVAVPALGPAPLAFDFAFPVAEASTDEKQTFSFYMGLNRRF